MVLTERQQKELHRAIASYLKAYGFEKTCASFAEECSEAASCTDSDHGQLETKWTSVLRLQKKVLDLESKNKALTRELEEYATGGINVHAKQSKWSKMLPVVPAWQTLSQHRGPINTVALHPTFNVCVSGSEDCSVRVWNLDSGVCEQVLTDHVASVEAVCFSPDGALLATCSKDLYIKIWNTEGNQWRCTKTLQGHRHSLSSVCFVGGGSGGKPLRLLSASRDETVKLWDPVIGYAVSTLEPHAGWVRWVSCSADSTLFATAHNDYTVRVWQLETMKSLVVLRGHEHLVECVEFAPLCTARAIEGLLEEDGEKAAEEGDAKSSSVSTSGRGREKESGSSSSLETAKEPSGAYLFSVSRDNTMRLWNINSGQCLQVFADHTNWVRRVTFHPGGLYAVTCSDDKDIRVWDVTSGRCVKTLRASNQFVWCISSTLPHATSVQTARKVLFVSGDVENVISVWQCR